MNVFTARLEIPKSGNKYYNRKASGGYSNAIQGKPVCEGLDVLSNCVGYAAGRFSEIAKDTSMHYLKPVNAELFIDYRDVGLDVGYEPKLGACAVWQKGSTKSGQDGAGHVAIVEVINNDGSIITSESGYNCSTPFFLKTRNNKDGRWGQNTTYKFLGFIYQPIEYDAQTVTKGCRGDYVKTVQVILKGYGLYSGKIDGSAGPLTSASINAFQRHSNGALVVDGIFGPKCWEYFMKGGQ